MVPQRLLRLSLLLALASCLAVAWSALGLPARGDGLVFQLPADGTFAKFDLEMQGEGRLSKGTLTMSSVGHVVAAGEKCRWIEFKMVTGVDGRQTIRAKLLVPEKHLGRGQHAYAHVVKAYQQFGDQVAQRIDTKTNRNVGPLPAFLSGPPKQTEALEAVEVDSGLGKLECKGIKGQLVFQDGMQDIQVAIEERLHSKSPFGVVSFTMNFKVRRDGQTREQGTVSLVLATVGKEAQSELADSN